jgi:hypothetical protein
LSLSQATLADRPGEADPRWLFSARADTAAFLGAALAAGLLAGLGSALGIGSETPLWAWVLLVLCIDVAHVWSTLFRVYLDVSELRRRPLLYFAAPLGCWLAGVFAYHASAALFWRGLAYLAAWHFVRQQVGFMALYGRRAGSPRWQRRLDETAIYAATLGPLLWWHAHLPRAFWWFVEGDFASGLPAWCGTAALAAHFAVLGVWLLAWLRHRHLGKLVFLAATFLAWFGGIVLAQNDFQFTVMNVTLHGVPYLLLNFRYARGREVDDDGYGRLSALVRLGLPAFAAVVLGLAFTEELAWDRLVWHERGALFGHAGLELTAPALALVVPLLAVPQTTHYLLDAFVWRGKENPDLAARLGWERRPAQQLST